MLGYVICLLSLLELFVSNLLQKPGASISGLAFSYLYNHFLLIGQTGLIATFYTRQGISFLEMILKLT
jgi:hypothetical protein